MEWFTAAAAAASTAASAMQERAASAASAVQERLEDEREGFLAEFQRCSAAAAMAAPRAAAPRVSEALPPAGAGGAGASSGSGALDRFKRVGMTLFNPLADQDSVSATARASMHGNGVVMLPWEQPGLSTDVRARMRQLSHDRSVFLLPPACLPGLRPPFVFSLQASVDVVLEALSVDKRLEAQRHALVPKEISEDLFFFHYFAHLHALATGAIPAIDPSPSILASAEAAVRSDAESSAVAVSNSSGSEATEVAVPGSPTSPTRSPRGAEGSADAEIDLPDAELDSADAEIDALALELDAISKDTGADEASRQGTLISGDNSAASGSGGGADMGGGAGLGGTGARDATVGGGGLPGGASEGDEEADAEAEWEAELRAELEGLQ